mmetsp:Transcript_7255/g.12228  ORF Transcript_7255/g.12228 Transcript_7255/m.12228 type:complete len:233 (-) Transcript_7255:45-743(-)
MFGARLRKAPERLAQLTSPTLVQQQKPSRPSTLSEGRLRDRSATVAEKIKVLAQAAQLPTDAKGRKRGLADVAAETGGLFSPRGIRHVIREAAALKGDEEEPLARKSRVDKGVPKVLTPTKQKAMHEKAEEWDGEWTNEDMAHHLNEKFGKGTITAQGIGYHCNFVLPDDWAVEANVRVKPLLSTEQREQRVGFCCQALWEKPPPGTVRAHVDEKWFFARKLHGKRRMPQVK